MQKIFCPETTGKDLLYAIPGFAYFLYILFPFRFWEPFVFSSQTETVVVTTYFSCILLLFALLKVYRTTPLRFTKIDLFATAYGIYLLCRFRYPLENESFYTVFSVVCIYLYFRNFPDNYLKALLFLLLLAGVVQMIDGVSRFTIPWQNLSHITGIFNNTGLFGGFAGLGFVVCAGLFLFGDSSKRHFKSIVVAALGVALAVQVYASGSRASWVAAIAGSIVVLIQNSKFGIRNPKFGTIILLFCLAAAFLTGIYYLKKDSADGRLLIARISLEMVKEAPVFGNGISGFRTGYLNHQAAYFQSNTDSPFRMLADDVEMPFNEFLKILIEQGMIGLLLFVCVLYSLFEKEKTNHIQNAGKIVILQSALLFILIFGLFSYPFDKLPFVALFVCFLASLSRFRQPVFEFESKKTNVLRILLLFVLCLMSGAIACNAYSYADTCRAWNRALANFGIDREKSLSQLKKLYPELKNNSVFLTTYGKALSFGEYHQEATVVLEKAVARQPLSLSYIELGKSYEAAGFPEKALACWKHAGWMVPARFAPLYLAMKLHFKNGEYDRAKEYAGQLLAKKIKIDSPEIDQMKREAEELRAKN